MPKWKKEKAENRTTFSRAGTIANNSEIDNAVTMELAHSINGSGEKHFGGAKKWPRINVKIGFQAGEEKTRDEIAKKIRDFIDTLI